MDQRIDLVSQPHIGMIDMLIVAQREDRLMQSNGIGEELGGTSTHSRLPITMPAGRCQASSAGQVLGTSCDDPTKNEPSIDGSFQHARPAGGAAC